MAVSGVSSYSGITTRVGRDWSLICVGWLLPPLDIPYGFGATSELSTSRTFLDCRRLCTHHETGLIYTLSQKNPANWLLRAKEKVKIISQSVKARGGIFNVEFITNFLEPGRGELHTEPHVRPISCHVASLSWQEPEEELNKLLLMKVSDRDRNVKV